MARFPAPWRPNISAPTMEWPSPKSGRLTTSWQPLWTFKTKFSKVWSSHSTLHFHPKPGKTTIQTMCIFMFFMFRILPIGSCWTRTVYTNVSWQTTSRSGTRASQRQNVYLYNFAKLIHAFQLQWFYTFQDHIIKCCMVSCTNYRLSKPLVWHRKHRL